MEYKKLPYKGKDKINQNIIFKNLALPAILLASLGLLSNNALAQQKSFPDTPLQTSANKPAANIMFILDDSGSMAYDYMPEGLNYQEFYRKNYYHNALAYNPNINYKPWKNWNQSEMTGGKSYDHVYTDNSRLTGATSLRFTTQVFYAPKNSNVSKGSTDNRNYYRYSISNDGWYRFTYERCEARSKNGYFNYNCQYGNNARPTNRSWDDELENYAIWYSYHRTRMKVAKAGVTEAFAQLNGNIRLGYDSIWNRNSLDIPVNSDGGLFRDNNKQVWFRRILDADAVGGTPLHGALNRAGEYFQSTSSSGPWGPEEGSAQYSCRQNFTILTSDGYWNNSDDYGSLDEVGNADGEEGDVIISSKGERYKYTPTRPFSDNHSDTLADIAMHYWKNDLRDDLDNNVPASVDNPAFWQHMVTFGISIGLEGSLDPKTDLPSLQNGSKSWKDPWRRNGTSGSRSWNNESPYRIDDLWHASVNGRGKFSVATDPEEFSRGLKSALGSIQKTLASGSNVSTSSTSLQTDTRIFHATYYSGIWTGEMAAFDISSAGVAQDPTWVASQNIKRYNQRNIVTSNSSGKGRDFPTDDQKSRMKDGLNNSSINADHLADFIKGDQSREEINGGPFRNRDSILGDIVNSSPVYSADTDTLFIGANDGMLHAVNATTGAELFAYVPKGINFEDLGTTADPEYQHRYFVDGQQVVSSKRQTPGKNYLVGALGRGGRGVYGLDVTNPNNFKNNDVLWDNTDPNDNDMGYVIGEIIITKSNNGKHIALVPNGIDSKSGTAALYIIDITDGSVIKKIDTGVKGGNGLFAPRGWDEDRNGTVDYVYAGDLKGNLWKFDLTKPGHGAWKVDLGGNPLFRARDKNGNPQPITGGLALGVENFGSRTWVLFGTGKYISQLDITDDSVQSVYGVLDDNTNISRNELEERDIQIVSGADEANKLRAFETFSPLPSGKKGWVIDLDDPYPGERVIERGFLSGRVFVFPSVVPTSGNACESSGKGFINAIDAFTGTTVSVGGVDHNYFDVGNDGDVDNDYLEDGDTRIPVGSIETDIGMVTKPVLVGDQIVYGGSSGGKGTNNVNLPPAAARRLSWREISE